MSGNRMFRRAAGRSLMVNGRPFDPSAGNADYSIWLGHRYQRFETLPGDRPTTDSSGQVRAELVNALGPFSLADTDYWVSFSSRVTVSPSVLSAAQVGGWLICGQLHGTQDASDISASPVVALQYSDNQRQIVSRTSTVDPLVTNPTATVRGTVNGSWQSQWINHVLKFRWNTAGTGKLWYWANGAQICALDNIPLGYVDVLGPHWQYGIYSGPDTQQHVIAEYANMDPPTTADLSARVTAPEPLPYCVGFASRIAAQAFSG